jgi:hypothetical protein
MDFRPAARRQPILHAPTVAVIYQFRELIVGRSTRVAVALRANQFHLDM